jgi:hypothetical protein
MSGLDATLVVLTGASGTPSDSNVSILKRDRGTVKVASGGGSVAGLPPSSRSLAAVASPIKRQIVYPFDDVFEQSSEMV